MSTVAATNNGKSKTEDEDFGSKKNEFNLWD